MLISIWMITSGRTDIPHTTQGTKRCTSCYCRIFLTFLVFCKYLDKAPNGGSSECRLKIIDGGVGTDVCYHKRDVKTLSCRRDERLLILNVLHRMKDRCSGHEECCVPSYSDEFYDIGHCVNESETFRSVVREVLKECSQQRYCVLVNEPGSSIHDLKDIDVDDGNIAASLMTTHECIKDGDSTLSFCSSISARMNHSKPVYISSQGISLAPSEVGSCRCNVSTRGTFKLTLLDVRLGRDPMNKLLLQTKTSVKERHVFTGGRESLYFGHTVDVRDSTLTIDLSVNTSHPPDSVWIKVEGNQMSEIEVTCYDQERTIPQATPFLRSEEVVYCVKPSPEYLPYLMFLVGFVVAFAFIAVARFIFLKVKRTKNSPSDDPADDQECVEPLYSKPIHLHSQGSFSLPGKDTFDEKMSPPSESPRSNVSSLDSGSVEPLYQLPDHGSDFSRQGSVSTWQGSITKGQSSVRVASPHLDTVSVMSDYDVAGIYRPTPKPHAQSKPDLSVYIIENKLDDLETTHNYT